jgi:hypothetical protein
MGKFDLSTLYACMEISQWTSFVQLIHSNKTEKVLHEKCWKIIFWKTMSHAWIIKSDWVKAKKKEKLDISDSNT